MSSKRFCCVCRIRCCEKRAGERRESEVVRPNSVRLSVAIHDEIRRYRSPALGLYTLDFCRQPLAYRRAGNPVELGIGNGSCRIGKAQIVKIYACPDLWIIRHRRAVQRVLCCAHLAVAISVFDGDDAWHHAI